MLRKLCKSKDPILKTVCKPVKEFDAELKKLVTDMTDTLKAFNAAGLAAPQIGEAKRIIIVKQQKGSVVLVYVNPVIVWQSDDIRADTEGCLSYLGIWKEISRPHNIIVRGYDVYGKPIEHGYHDFEARVFCHEIDHLNGMCRVGI
jgi:peptide deformylase